jgi:hypothetical protein
MRVIAATCALITTTLVPCVDALHLNSASDKISVSVDHGCETHDIQGIGGVHACGRGNISEDTVMQQYKTGATPGISDSGFYWICYLPPSARSSNALPRLVSEFQMSFEAARRLFPEVPKAVYANHVVQSRFEDKLTAQWIAVEKEDEVTAPHHQKLIGLKLTPFEYTIFLDDDLYLIKRNFWNAMQTLRAYADIAMPLDPTRSAPFDVLPMGCSALIAYSRNAFGLLDKAYELILNNTHPEGRRQSDQEMIYFAWREHLPSTRLLLLPQEFSCYWNGLSNVWEDAHMTYRCWALHDHGLDERVLDLQENETSDGTPLAVRPS